MNEPTAAAFDQDLRLTAFLSFALDCFKKDPLTAFRLTVWDVDGKSTVSFILTLERQTPVKLDG